MFYLITAEMKDVRVEDLEHFLVESSQEFVHLFVYDVKLKIKWKSVEFFFAFLQYIKK